MFMENVSQPVHENEADSVYGDRDDDIFDGQAQQIGCRKCDLKQA